MNIAENLAGIDNKPLDNNDTETSTYYLITTLTDSSKTWNNWCLLRLNYINLTTEIFQLIISNKPKIPGGL